MNNKKRIQILCWIGIVIFFLAACSSPTITKVPQAATTIPTVTPQLNSYPLSEFGPYHVGMRSIMVKDPSRGNRRVPINVWYPALEVQGSTNSVPIRDADPDFNGAPYPLILSSTKVARIFAPYLVSHGFTWASVEGLDTYSSFSVGAIDQPLDILFALDQVAANPPEGLEGMIDSDNSGTIGYSFDGFNSLVMSGARIDPQYYLSQCPNPDATTKSILGGLSAYGCTPSLKWDEFTAQLDESITSSQDGLWQPLTDPRIRAVMPMAGEGWWLFGERGLAAVDRPVMIIVGTNDELYKENVLIYEHLGTSDKQLISFIGLGHMMVYDQEMTARMAHFAIAFFRYHLQGSQDMAKYFSKDFVAQHNDLFWGVYSGE